ncbi:aminotransferase class III-fold pyridoxal phosphate-dependent enzyme [Variovorax paradoxus]|uniref:aminotransferase class III-fold pyridoxal phosphate-dependent enzyme n=1 Tax=Variovorax paradoxus TaxID=34073 RepID=UPI00399B9549
MRLAESDCGSYRRAMNTSNSPTAGIARIGDEPKGGSVLGFYAPKGSARPPRVARGEGVFLWDANGKRYLDATAGAVVANIGHGNPRVLAAMARRIRSTRSGRRSRSAMRASSRR